MRSKALKRIMSITLTLMMVFGMMVTTAGQVYAKASNETASSAKSLTLGEKTTITFDSNFNDRFYKIKITKKGTYKMFIYSDANDSNRDFWAGVYSSAKNATNMTNLINSENGLINSWDSKTDYELYKLDAGTYYIRVQGWNSSHKTTGLKFVKTTNTFNWYYYKSYMYRYETVGVYVEDINYKEAYITSITSSDTDVIKVNKTKRDDGKGYWAEIVGKSTGKAKITIKYTTPKGTKSTITRTLTVKKYPNMITSLKVNGNTIDITKNRFVCNRRSSKTTASVKAVIKDGWKIQNAYIERCDWDNDKYVEIKDAKKKILNGTSIDFPKSYDYICFEIDMSKGDEYTHYSVYITRPE